MNSCRILGEVVRGPVKRDTSIGTTFTCLSVKYDKGFNPHTERRESVIVSVVFRAALAEEIARICKKGDRLYVQGELNIRYFVDPQKIAHQITEILAKEAEVIPCRVEKKKKGRTKCATSTTKIEQVKLW